jgi:CDP-diacylglycerol--glycerol-3-phosphate 3-phosphatidyltransferase
MAHWGDKDAVVLRLAPFVGRLHVHPDTLTFAGVALSAGSAWMFYQGSLRAGAVLVGAAGLCDLLDGVVARRRGTATLAGGFLDSTLDRLSDMLVFGGIALGATRSADVGLAGLALWAVTAAVLTSYSRARAEVHLHSLQLGLMDRGLRVPILIAGALVQWLEPALAVIGAGGTWTALQRVRAARRHLRVLERDGVDPTRPSASTQGA